jgi:ribosomal protein L37AE/L43A
MGGNSTFKEGRLVSGTELTRKSAIVGEALERCIYCNGTQVTREGKRYKRRETVQLWYCRTCDRVFTAQRAKGKQYPLKVILESLIAYYRGETRERVAELIKERYGILVPARTLSAWLAEYRELTPYAKLRAEHLPNFRPNRIIRSVRLHHQQVYEYRIHCAKLESLLRAPKHEHLQPLEAFLWYMAASCPNGLFQADARASQGKTAYDLNAVEIISHRNHACRTAELVLQAVTINKRRHDEIQRFLLATDSVTVAVEVPIYLTPDELVEMKQMAGFDIPLNTDTTLTGHIDFLQIRNGAIHIVDYKPGAKSEKPIPQLMTYALALSRRTGLKLFHFVCSWFDQDHYYQFFPLHVVHKRGRLPDDGTSAGPPSSP